MAHAGGEHKSLLSARRIRISTTPRTGLASHGVKRYSTGTRNPHGTNEKQQRGTSTCPSVPSTQPPGTGSTIAREVGPSNTDARRLKRRPGVPGVPQLPFHQALPPVTQSRSSSHFFGAALRASPKPSGHSARSSHARRCTTHRYTAPRTSQGGRQIYSRNGRHVTGYET